MPKFGEWVAVPVRLPIALPPSATGSSLLKIYPWNDQGTSPAYLDDVVLRRVAN